MFYITLNYINLTDAFTQSDLQFEETHYYVKKCFSIFLIERHTFNQNIQRNESA